jgi:hypothetical protein
MGKGTREELDTLLESAWEGQKKRQKWAETHPATHKEMPDRVITKRTIDWNTVWPLVGLIVALISYIVIRNEAAIIISAVGAWIALSWLFIHLVSVWRNEQIRKMRGIALLVVIASFGISAAFTYAGWPPPAARHLRGNAEENFVNFLAQYPNTESIDVTAVENNTEANDFAEDIRKALKLARWKAPDDVSWMIGKTDPGITIYYRALNDQYRLVLQAAFRMANFDSSTVYRPQETSDLHIHVREKQ